MIPMQFSTFVILPTWAVFWAFSLPPSADSAYINIISTNGKQDVLKQPEANTDLLYFSGLSYHKSSVETAFLIFFAIASSHYDYRANMS